MEDEVASLLGADGKEKEALAGGRGGPQFVIKSASGDNSGSTRRTTAVSRAWRRSVKWLNVLARPATEADKKLATNRLRSYEQPSPEIGGATPRQKKGFAAFEAWRTLLTEERLQLSIWIDILQDLGYQERRG